MKINNKEVNIQNFKLKIKHYTALNKQGIDYFRFINSLQKFYTTNDMADFPGDDIIRFLGVILKIECGITEEDLAELDFDEITNVMTLLFPTDKNATQKDVGE